MFTWKLPSKINFTFTVRGARKAPISGTRCEPTVLPKMIVTIAL
jgi:hypothetical protein